MQSFEQTILALTSKLQSLPTIAPQLPSIQQPTANNLSINAQISQVQSLSQTLVQQSQELPQVYHRIGKQLEQYQRKIDSIIRDNIEQIDMLNQQLQQFTAITHKHEQQAQEQYIKNSEALVIQFQQQTQNYVREFDLDFKMLRKQIDKQLHKLVKTIKNMQQNPQNNLIQSNHNYKAYKQYYMKLETIQQNEKHKAQKINALEKKVQGAINRMYGHVSEKIFAQQKQIRGKYEKIKRLLVLITDIS